MKKIRKGFTLMEVMVSLGVLTAVLLVVNQVVTSSVQQVRASRNLFYVDTVLSEGVSHMDYIMKTNILRYGEDNFEECKMTIVDAGLAPQCDEIGGYLGRYILVVDGDLDSEQRSVLVEVKSGLQIVDDVDNPTAYTKGFEFFEIFEKQLKNGGVIYTNFEGEPNANVFKRMGFYRYIDVYDNGDFLVTVVYKDELGGLSVETGSLLSN